jgi:acyl dehydratase
MPSMSWTHTVTARNLSAQSENRIHDDTVARRFGFQGALVPGVEVYAYAVHPALAHWGREWLSGGSAGIRFLQPVYDGDAVQVAAEAAEDGLAVTVRVGERHCASGQLGPPLPGPAPDPAGYSWRAPPAERPPASEASLAPGTILGTAPFPLTEEVLGAYLEAVGEAGSFYAAEGIAHPGLILRQCNQALVQNVALGPWIHTGSTVRSLRPARLGEALTVRARVVANEARKGHRFVDLDALVLGGDGTPVAQVAHTAIWRPRQLDAAA